MIDVWSPSNIFQLRRHIHGRVIRLVTYHSLPRCSGSLSLSLCESGAKYLSWRDLMHMLSKVDVTFKQHQSMFGSSASSMNSGIPGIPLFVKDTTVIILNARQPRLAVRRFSCIPPAIRHLHMATWLAAAFCIVISNGVEPASTHNCIDLT